MIKLITGFRPDQFHSINEEEAHKAYYLFLNPDERGVFDNGVALIGKDIRSIEPDYHGTMGWHPTHILASEDYHEIHQYRVDIKLKEALEKGKEVAEFIFKSGKKELLNEPLEIAHTKLITLGDGRNSDYGRLLAEKFKI